MIKSNEKKIQIINFPKSHSSFVTVPRLLNEILVNETKREKDLSLETPTMKLMIEWYIIRLSLISGSINYAIKLACTAPWQ